jgi:transmembrane sensor
MSVPDDGAADRTRASRLLDLVGSDPQVRTWLREAETNPQWQGSARRGYAGWVAAASVVLAVLLGIVGYLHFAPVRYETRVGEQRDVRLPDGSLVTLNTGTAISIRYDEERRYIELERGEALFSVEHDAARPFDVAAGGTLTRALGTEFNVDLRAAQVTVSVLQGAVRVAAIEAQLPVTALGKGQALKVHRDDRRVLEAEADLRRIHAWRTRRLEFDDTPLAEAIEEFNRYSSVRVTLGTETLGTVRVSGMFRVGDAESFLFSLREVLNLQAHESAGEVVLMRGPERAE